MNKLFTIIIVIIIVGAISAPDISATDRAHINRHKDDYYSLFQDLEPDPEIDWPVWIGVQRTDRIIASFNCDGTFGIAFAHGPAEVPEWPYRSFESPRGSGVEYLYGGAIWIGGIVNEDTLVSVGNDGWIQGFSMFPTATVEEYNQGSIRNFDYKSSYALRAEFADTIPDTVLYSRPSDPLNILVSLRSYVWRETDYDQAVVYDMVLTNIGSETIEKGFVGLYIDADACFDCTGTNGWQDDLTGTLANEKIAYIFDNDGDLNAVVSAPKAFAVKFLHTSFEPGTINYNWWISNGATVLDFGPRKKGTVDDPFREFEGGGLGTPGTAEDKYYILSHPEWDFDQVRTYWVINNDTTWLPPNLSFAGTFAYGYDSRFLLSVGPFDLASDSSARIIFTTFTGEKIHTVPDNMVNLPTNPDSYLDNLTFSDLIATADAASQVMNDSLLDSLAPPIGFHLQSKHIDSVVLEWDPWVFDGIVGYAIYLSEVDHNDLPYPGVAAPWLKPNHPDLYASLQRTHRVTVDNLVPEQFYFAQITNRTISTIGQYSSPLIFQTDSKTVAPGLTQEFFFYQNGSNAVITWAEPPGIDIDHYNIYRFDSAEEAGGAYHAFYDQGLNLSSIIPKDQFEVENITYYYYALEPLASVDSSTQSFVETNPIGNAVYLITAVSKRGFESEFSQPITTLLTDARDKDFLVITNSLEGFVSFTDYADIVSFYQSVLSGYEFDFYSISDTTGGLCQPTAWPCIDWHDFMRYRYIIIDDKLHDYAWSEEFEQREAGFTKYILAGGNLIYFGEFNGLRGATNNDTTGTYPIESSYISRFFGIDSIYSVSLLQYASTPPFLDTLFGFTEASSVFEDAPSLSFDSSSTIFNSFLDVFWPSNTAPKVAAFHPTTSSVTHSYHSLYPATSIHDGKAVGIRTESDFGITYLFGFHLWYMDSNNARQLVQWLESQENNVATDIDQPTGNNLPTTFSLHQNFPNPFNPSTTISFDLPKRAKVDLDIFNILGRKVKTLHSGSMTAGKHSLVWDGQNESGDQVTSGVYFYRLQTEEVTSSKKMVLLK